MLAATHIGVILESAHECCAHLVKVLVCEEAAGMAASAFADPHTRRYEPAGAVAQGPGSEIQRLPGRIRDDVIVAGQEPRDLDLERRWDRERARRRCTAHHSRT